MAPEFLRENPHIVRATVYMPQADSGWEKETSPGLRSNGIVENTFSAVLLESIVASALLIGPSHRQVCSSRYVVVDDCALADRWADEAVAALSERVE